MAEHPLKVYEELDPKLLNLVNNTRDLALADGALPRKVKLLIAMVLDAVHGASEGVQALAREAIKAGASQRRNKRGAAGCSIHLWRRLRLYGS
jgi:alkylhydroperoxidase/carboxymuconolactone decarboxylase family protein YurZ